MVTKARSNLTRICRLLGIAAALDGGAVLASPAHAAAPFGFDLVRNSGLPQGCATNAKASVKLSSLGFAEKLTISIGGFAPDTKLDFFVIQVPGVPFGLSWYLGDLDANGAGRGTKTFVTRLNEETFAVAPGSVAAPNTHPGQDDTKNPVFRPIHTYHLGVWFNSPEDAEKNGSTCPTFTTPFNGDHTAGVQVLNSAKFPDLQGPLSQIK